MRLRTRLALSFGAAAGATLLFFSVVVLAALTISDMAGKSWSQPRFERELAENTRGVVIAMIVGAPVAVGGAAAAGIWLARRAVSPLQEASARARVARGSELDLTLPLNGSGDEWDVLASTLNSLLADSRTAMERIRRFTADAAHELRTPLTAIVGEAEVSLRRERTSQELRASLEIVREQSKRLAELLDALLTLARADAGTLLVGSSQWSLDATVSEAAAIAFEDARKRGADARPIAIQGVAGDVEGDRVLVLRAVRNLLENAFLHGGGAVSVQLASDLRWRHILIADQGPGIPTRVRPRLFERFAQADESRSGDGLGLGLAISKAIVEAHGGAVRFVPVDRGAAFEIDLPVPQLSANAPQGH
ncbi:MAG TPA: HAMP domain-containing sensor histidine kinase [Casimicrobiaceae bacterium]|nr:HAMP domain-containing sensor histidine kinase [Casimicrobiaceae bacterium]